MHASLASWKLESRAEPVIRVGFVLPQDGMTSLHLNVPDKPYHIGPGWSGDGDIRGSSVEVRVAENGVAWRSGITSGGPAGVVRIMPGRPIGIARGAGVKLHNVVTGRGFHWQKRFHPTVLGGLEFRAVDGHLLVVNELPLEEYLAGVIAGEMSGQCPLEFLKSQCVVARSWVLAHTENKHTELPVDRCNDDCCQRYHGTTDVTETVLQAVRDTRGQVILHGRDRIIDANYSKSCGGIIEAPEHVWFVSKPGQRAAVDAPPGDPAHGFFPATGERLQAFLSGDWLARTQCFCSPNVVPERDLPRYLGKVDEGGGHFRWRVEYDRADLEEILRRKHFSRHAPELLAGFHTLAGLEVIARGPSGRASELQVDYLDPMGARRNTRIRSEYAIRDALHESFLFSSAFEIEAQQDADSTPARISLLGAGWGHGAGLCQIGALGMSVMGYRCEQILSHYFEGITIHTAY